MRPKLTPIIRTFRDKLQIPVRIFRDKLQLPDRTFRNKLVLPGEWNSVVFTATATAYKECEEIGIIRAANGHLIYIDFDPDAVPLVVGANIKIGDEIFTVADFSTPDDTITLVENTGEIGGFLAYSTGEPIQYSTGEVIASTS